MTLKIYKLISLPTLFSKIKSTKLPFKTSYHLTLLSQEIDKHVNYYQEEFRKLLFEYGMQDENGNLIPTPDGQGVLLIEEKTEEAYGKIFELRDLDVQLPDYYFSINEFDKIELSMEEMIHLIPFIKE